MRARPGVLAQVALAAAMAAAPAAVFSLEEHQTPWTVTPEQRAQKNPSAPTARSTADGGQVYLKNCLACHGATGDGRGPVALRLGFSAGDLTRGAEMRARTDGELFWKIAMGRDPMPAFRKEKGLTDAQIWDVVNYIRTLARK